MVRTPAAIRCPPAQFHASVPLFLRFLFPAESCGHAGLHTLAIYLPAFPHPPFESLHLFSFLSTVTRLIGFALHGNAGCRCFKIEKWCKSVFPFSTTRFQLCKSFSKARWCTTGGIQWCTLLKEDSSEALFEQSIGAQCKRSRAES